MHTPFQLTPPNFKASFGSQKNEGKKDKCLNKHESNSSISLIEDFILHKLIKHITTLASKEVLIHTILSH